MKLNKDTYVPSLRWRQGEYQALLELEDSAKGRVVPFVCITEIEYDFEKQKMSKTLQEHVETFPKRYKAKWGNRPAWIDVNSTINATPMDNGQIPVAWVFDRLHDKHGAVPVTSFDAKDVINNEVKRIVKRDGRGVGIRARIEHVMKPSFGATLAALMAKLGVTAADTDLIIDLGCPNYEPYADFADALTPALSGIPSLKEFRSYVLMGCAYPETVPIQKPGGNLPRHDWLFFAVFLKKLPKGSRVPNFGDYTIVNPNFTPQDMRKIQAPGKVVYTDKNNWYIRKGGAFNLNRAQMHDHCEFIMKSDKFRGPKFSYGDQYIEDCAKKKNGAGPSTQTTWKKVAINHHIMHVLEDLAKQAAAA